MRRNWLNRVLGRVDTEQVRAELLALAADGDWASLLAESLEALKPLPTDVVILNCAVRARLALADETTLAEALAECREWLEAGQVSAEVPVPPEQQVEAEYLRGWVATLDGRWEQAEQCWRTVWQAQPERADARDGLVKAWTVLGRVPEWGVALVEATLADSRG
ncbi:MAG: hypothetical protein HZB16_00580 [Armatimonadetes bacterium]|nr:hypothetical protein [Armatimonadota bacterium]